MGNIHGNGVNVDRGPRTDRPTTGRPMPDFLSPPTTPGSCRSSRRSAPTGRLYVLDWYDRYHCYQDANRDPNGIDRLKGRLYRVRYKVRPPEPQAFNLALAKPTMPAHRSIGEPQSSYYARGRPDDFSRRTRTDPTTRPKLGTRLAINPKRSRVKARLHALWALIGTGQLDPGHPCLRLLIDPEPDLPGLGRPRASGNFGKVRSGDPARRVEVPGRRPLARRPAPGRGGVPEDR